MDKCKKEVIVTKEKYEQALLELNSYNGRYIEDMAEVGVVGWCCWVVLLDGAFGWCCWVMLLDGVVG